MTTTIDRNRLRRRLLPLQMFMLVQGTLLWVPVEKLFMSEIGFDAASVGVMAAAYAAVVPLIEVPSGILADRWSRRGVLTIGSVALATSTLIGGLSTNVGTYVVAAMVLGIYFAMQSGTLESIVYDTVLEETGSGEGFERVIGRIRMFESLSLVVSAVAGGLLASVTSPRLTYFATVPFGLLAIKAIRAFDEPRLHREGDQVPLRQQVAMTYRTLLERGQLRPIILVMVLMAVLLQAIIEFGPLWMVALAAPTLLFGPHWAGLMSALGLGAVLAGRVVLTRRVAVWTVTTMVVCALALTVTTGAVVVIVAQITLALIAVAIGVVLSRRLHDAVPSTIRAGVASGVGTLTWLTFLPFAVVFGFVSDRVGVEHGGWMIVAIIALATVPLVRLAAATPVTPAAPVQPTSVGAPPIVADAHAGAGAPC